MVTRYCATKNMRDAIRTRLVICASCGKCSSSSVSKKIVVIVKAAIMPKEHALLKRGNQESIANRTSKMMVQNQVNHISVTNPIYVNSVLPLVTGWLLVHIERFATKKRS